MMRGPKVSVVASAPRATPNPFRNRARSKGYHSARGAARDTNGNRVKDASKGCSPSNVAADFVTPISAGSRVSGSVHAVGHLDPPPC